MKPRRALIARVKVGAQGADSRFIVPNLAGGKAKGLYEDLYCRRGREPH
ncbi:hypothetical protein X753_31240 [Mesorhizobium sp. LNJC399B00]|nr:hypothetical protein X753_31240 [Mesorhizobium sp. LNJC399B00]